MNSRLSLSFKIKCFNKAYCAKSVQIRSFCWSVFSRIRSISPYSVQMWENTDHKKLRIWTLFTQWPRSSNWRCSVQEGIFKNFTNFTVTQLYWNLLFNKVAGLKACNFIKKRLQRRSFPIKFAKFLRIPFFIEHLPTTASTRPGIIPF